MFVQTEAERRRREVASTTSDEKRSWSLRTRPLCRASFSSTCGKHVEQPSPAYLLIVCWRCRAHGRSRRTGRCRWRRPPDMRPATAGRRGRGTPWARAGEATAAAAAAAADRHCTPPEIGVGLVGGDGAPTPRAVGQWQPAAGRAANQRRRRRGRGLCPPLWSARRSVLAPTHQRRPRALRPRRRRGLCRALSHAALRC